MPHRPLSDSTEKLALLDPYWTLVRKNGSPRRNLPGTKISVRFHLADVVRLSRPLRLRMSPADSSVVAVFPGHFDPRRAAAVPRNLLLLSKGILSGVLPSSPGLCGKRRRQGDVPRRDSLSLHSAKPSSLVSLSCIGVSLLPLVGRHSRFLLPGWIWNWRGLACPAGKYRAAHPLHVLLPLPASPGGRKA